jgi:hypothetical protein
MSASDLGRFEPTPYDLGISDNPDASWSDPQADADPCPCIDCPEPEAEP